ncbi:MAG: hypothetical protein ACK49N_06345 [Verrucomicrobiota bacterium]
MFAVRIQLGVPTASSAWVHEIIERKQRAARSITAPKLVLLGGSGTLFGHKASVLEDELGVPVINGGFHAGLGMDCILREGKKMLRPGDTVMLFPEYELLSFGEKNRREWAAITYLDYMLSRNSKHYLTLPMLDQIEIALMTPLDRIGNGIKSKWIQDELSPASEYNPYDVVWLDEHGDMTGHYASRRPAFAEDRDQRICEPLVKGISLQAEGFKLISEFNQWAKANRVEVLAGFPSMVYRKEYNSNRIDTLESMLRSFYFDQRIDVVGCLRDSLFSQNKFYDTVYHPTEEVSHRISMILAYYLRKHLWSYRK